MLKNNCLRTVHKLIKHMNYTVALSISSSGDFSNRLHLMHRKKHCLVLNHRQHDIDKLLHAELSGYTHSEY